MARPVWTGTISFGLVNIGVGLYSATENRDVSFHQFEEGTGKRVRNKRVAEGTDREVKYDDITKGYETDSGDHVIVTQEELEAVQPETSRTITIDDFVELAEIDPIYYQRSYYLAPRSEEQAHAYALLRDAMKESGLAGIAKLVMRNKEYLATIRAEGDVLVLNTMFFADEIRDPHEVADILPGQQELPQREFDTAVKLIEQLSTSWKPENYHDTYREQVLKLIEQKAKGEEVEVAEPEEPEDNVVDLVAALERSIEQARGSKSASGGGSKSTSSGGSKSGSGGTSKGRSSGGSKSGSRSKAGSKSGGKGKQSGKKAS
ncbi:non-homologous end joining protein Ku [Phytoactinopolyspora halotolerans]|uniref:Non-homologous end joining protein Ku n=1 Tax=Phytoactinopolyspora halotolerans TaxID=1981512 RepID=A0A6L9S4B8_9ACTN|nr:Ku protein [Phytoactinopolyspora halotolerans]NED99975.1 Ku protein [Phytoactinopolyspora halotolerans]